MLEYAPMLHVSYYAQNYAGIIRQGLLTTCTCQHEIWHNYATNYLLDMYVGYTNIGICWRPSGSMPIFDIQPYRLKQFIHLRSVLVP